MAVLFRARLVATACVILTVDAEIFEFRDTPVPGCKELRGLYLFYMYADKDAPAKGAGQAQVEFREMVVRSTTPAYSDRDLVSYESIEVTIVPWDSLYDVLDPKSFCSTEKDVDKGLANRQDVLFTKRFKDRDKRYGMNDVFNYTVRFPATVNHKIASVAMPVTTTGVYILLVSNCRDFANASISGKVVVTSSFGYLPGNEYHKLPFYGWLTLFYVILSVIWLALSLRWWKSMVRVHSCVAMVIFLGLAEATLTWIIYGQWNSSGQFSEPLARGGNMLGVMKVSFSFYALLLMAYGWGVETSEVLDKELAKIKVACATYIPVEAIRQCVMSYRYRFGYGGNPVMVCIGAAILEHGSVLLWIFCWMSSLKGALRARGEVEKYSFIARVTGVIGVMMLAFVAIAIMQLADAASDDNDLNWKRQCAVYDGFSHVVFVAGLAALMCVFSPGDKSLQYMPLFSDKAVDEGKDDECEELTVMGEGKIGRVGPDVIGAQDDEDEGENTLQC